MPHASHNSWLRACRFTSGTCFSAAIFFTASTYGTRLEIIFPLPDLSHCRRTSDVTRIGFAPMARASSTAVLDLLPGTL